MRHFVEKPTDECGKRTLRGHCVKFLDKTLYSRSASLPPRTVVDAGGNSTIDHHPIKKGGGGGRRGWVG